MRNKTVILLPLVLLLGCACGGGRAVPEPSGYHTAAGMIVAPDGQALFLRGINVREEAKYHSAHIIPLADGELVELTASGFTAVRLLAFWQAVMPQPDTIDEDYLDRLEAEARRLDGHGFFLVIDMHQDLWGDPFGNGAPAWACPDELKQDYQPQDPWWSNYFSDQVTACFDNFWADDALQAAYAGAWRAVAGRLCGLERLVGFDLMNEPFPGSSFAQPDSENALLAPFYQRLADAIEEVCPEKIFFLEPSRAYDLGLSRALDIPARLAGRVALAPHFYPPAVHEDGAGYDGDAAALADSLDGLYDDYRRQGVPVWLGEFGGLTGNPNFAAYLVDLQRIMFERNWGGALWAYSRGDGGFSFLDAAGERKQVFTDFCAVPVPVRLPDAPPILAADFLTPALEVEVNCRAQRVVELLLPGAGRWQVAFEPPGVLEQPSVSGHLLSAACRGEGSLTLTVSALH